MKAVHSVDIEEELQLQILTRICPGIQLCPRFSQFFNLLQVQAPASHLRETGSKAVMLQSQFLSVHAQAMLRFVNGPAVFYEILTPIHHYREGIFL